MTFQEHIRLQLLANGLFESMVEEVMPIILNHENFKGTMDTRWNENVDNYPEMMKGLNFMAVKPIVLEWLEENHPEAWFKPMFMNEEDAKAYLGI